MKIDSAEYFYTNYVGHGPGDDNAYEKTQDMIAHYVDSDLGWCLPSIYEACAKDEVLDTKNRPVKLWEAFLSGYDDALVDRNLIEPGKFYMHHALTLNEPAPVYVPEGGMKTFRHYRENREFWAFGRLVEWARDCIEREGTVFSVEEDKGAMNFLLKRYEPLKKEGIQPLDVVLYLIDEHWNEKISLLRLKENEEDVLSKLRSYKAKLEGMNQYHVIWRGCLNE